MHGPAGLARARAARRGLLLRDPDAGDPPPRAGARRRGADAARRLWLEPAVRARLPAAAARGASRGASALERQGDRLRSAVRFSSLGPLLFAHSAYPTTDADAVFFGPDTYRFAALIEQRIERAGAVADIGCGSGAGGLLLARRAQSVQLLDINPRAVRFARANAELNGLAARAAQSDVLSAAEGRLDLIIANPPYLADDLRRAYRDGGEGLGTALSARIAREALERLLPGGRLLLYTATPVVDGAHLLWPALERLLSGTRWDYRELDPDVFGEELDRYNYATVERIAVVALDVTRR